METCSEKKYLYGCHQYCMGETYSDSPAENGYLYSYRCRYYTQVSGRKKNTSGCNPGTYYTNHLTEQKRLQRTNQLHAYLQNY